MITMPTIETLESALRAAGEAHHDYESDFLGGERDREWPGWYAAYVLGRLGAFARPTALTRWLADAPGDDGDWAFAAARHVSERLEA